MKGTWSVSSMKDFLGREIFGTTGDEPELAKDNNLPEQYDQSKRGNDSNDKKSQFAVQEEDIRSEIDLGDGESVIKS